MMNPLHVARDVTGRALRSAAKAEQRRVEIEIARNVRPALIFSAAEGVLGLLTLADAARRKSWLSYAMGVTLLGVSCAHAFVDIRDGKVLDLLSDKLS